MKRSVVAMAVAITFLATIVLSGSGSEVGAAAQTKAKWSKNYQGRLALVKQLRKELNRGEITDQQMLRAVSKIGAVNDQIARDLAVSYRYSKNYNELVRGLADKGGDVSAQSGGGGRDCNSEAWGAFLGCQWAGGDFYTCQDYGESYWCNCMGGAYLGNGFCYGYF